MTPQPWPLDWVQPVVLKRYFEELCDNLLQFLRHRLVWEHNHLGRRKCLFRKRAKLMLPEALVSKVLNLTSLKLDQKKKT
jgi:hypothetical protein